MNVKKIDISVITPFYHGNNCMERLFGCIRRNARAAEDIGIELIIVNDSPDCPVCYDPAWVDGFSLQIHSNLDNLGIHGSRIRGLDLAKGEFIVFLDQDDLLADHALMSQYMLAGDSDVVVANGYNENRDRQKPIFHSPAHQRQVSLQRFYLSVGCLIVSPGQCMIRKTAIPELWKERKIRCNGADDYFLWLLLLNRPCRWKENPEVLYTHVDTGENMSADLERMLRSSEEVLNILRSEGLLTERQVRLAARRFDMRRMYEGRGKWRKAAACLRYPDLFRELILLTILKKRCY